MRLQLDSMEVDCVIGDLPGERDREQTLSIDVTLEVSDGAAESDSIADTVDYALLAGNVARALKAARCRMIERAAKIAWDECMAFPNTLAAKVRVSKKGAVARLAGASAEYCGEDGPFADGAGPRIETIARGICIEDGRLLVCRAKGSATCYLPGGHVEFGESAREALRREMMEEAGLDVEAGGFRGVAENSFMQKGAPHSEVNIVFSMEIPSARGCAAVESREDWIEFEWVRLDSLGAAGLLPEDFRRLGREPDAFFGPK